MPVNLYLLVCDSLVTIYKPNNTAFFKSVFFNLMLHYFIIFMRINAKMCFFC